VSEGAGPFTVLLAGDGPARELLERRVRELGLDGSVRFLGHRRDINRVYQVADLTVLPSLSEAFGQVLIESLCFGTGVVATKVGGIPEIVQDGRTGLLVNPADPPDLARALRASVQDPGRREEMAAAGRARVREVFDSRRTARNNEAVYDELLARAGRR
jgi:glycosyltransferase involved in cell wall biosynthesis